MTISKGTRLGPYEIVDSLGAGGMGEVWRAKDTRLDRDVAIKILPPGFAESEQLLQRFEREARAISSLNHPHICTLYDVGQTGLENRDPGLSQDSSPDHPASGLHYLVMELIEGDSLADRLKKGPLPIHEVLKYGQQIASALDAAHRQGITHRDLKPGNIMLTRSGAKLLDFGLAKTAVAGVVDGLTNLPTEARPLTQEGTILGTFQYMAPEQLEGLEADARTDIFALGAVLYEMATGRRAFQGESKTSLIAAIVSSQPEPISSMTTMTPPALDHVVRKCLEKDRDDRWQSAHDVASELKWISETGSAAGVAMPLMRRRLRLTWIGWLVALLVAIAWLGSVWTEKPELAPRLETSILPPEGVAIDSTSGGIALSPDGRMIAFVGHGEGEPRRIWIRDLGSSSTRVLEGTEAASSPVWSPDGRFILYKVEGSRLAKIPSDGGSAEVIVTGNLRGASWTRSGEIIYSNGSIYRIGASGGAPTKLLEEPNRLLTNPLMLPDDRHFLFTSVRGAREKDMLRVGSLDGEEPRTILEDVYSNTAFASPGFILFMKDGDLRAQRVDTETYAPIGEPVRIAAGVQYDPDVKSGLFTISESGSIAYVTGELGGRTELAWVSREGEDLEVVGPRGMYYSPRISHDGSRIAVDVSDSKTASGDIWIIDVQREASTRLTWDQANESSPVWTPDDRSVIFFSEKLGSLSMFERSAGGVGEDEVVLVDEENKIPLDVSPDGRWLAYSLAREGSKADVWLFDREEEKARPFLSSPFEEGIMKFSPDGKWVVYASDESGQSEVYVIQFPASSRKWIVSRGGGSQPAWSRDGREIYYLSKDQQLMSVKVMRGETFDSEPPVGLFHAPVRSNYPITQYDVSPDGSRFLLNRVLRDQQSRAITYVQNWTTAGN